MQGYSAWSRNFYCPHPEALHLCLAVADLWAQDKVRSGAIELCTILSAEKPADTMTKYIEKPLLEKVMLKMNMHVMEGRAACAPATAGC